MTSNVFQGIKKWVKVLWAVPAVKSAALTLVVRAVVFVGLPAGATVLAAPVIEAVVSNL
jgi:hypothetical protein